VNHYEILFIIASTVEDEKREAVVETVKGIISDGSGTVTQTEILGLRKLAYPIQKKNDGYYVRLEFDAPPELPAELDRRLRISDDVVRHIIVVLDKK